MHFKVYFPDLFATLRNIKIHTPLGFFGGDNTEARRPCLGRPAFGLALGLADAELDGQLVYGLADLERRPEAERCLVLPRPRICGRVQPGLFEGLIEENPGGFRLGF